MFVPRDTTPEAARVQVELWRRMTPRQRSRMAAELSENVRRTAMAGVRERHSEYSDEEVRLAMYEQIYGKKLVDRL